MSFFQNCQKPNGFGGKLMVSLMNLGHSPIRKWGFSHIQIKADFHCLDVGCGGGATVKELFKKSPNGKVIGLDFSEVSVEKSKKLNKNAIEKNQCEIIQGDVMELPFEKESFDLVTAFETIYFWPDLQLAFQEIHKVLRKDGTLLICNEYKEQNESNKKYTDIIQGMRIHSTQKVVTLLKNAGFRDIQYDEKKSGWMCVWAKK